MFIATLLSRDSGRFGSLIVSSSIRVGDIDSILVVAVDNSSCWIIIQAVILFEESLSWYKKSSTIV